MGVAFNAANGKIYTRWDATNGDPIHGSPIIQLDFFPYCKKRKKKATGRRIRSLYFTRWNKANAAFLSRDHQPFLSFRDLPFALDVTFQPTTFALSKVHLRNPRLHFLPSRSFFQLVSYPSRALSHANDVANHRDRRRRHERLEALALCGGKFDAKSIVSSIKRFNPTPCSRDGGNI